MQKSHFKHIIFLMNEYKLIKLKNGLKLILVPKSSTEVVTAMIMFKVGSRYESDEIAGISHVLEHMHYKGTEKRPSGLKISEFIESLGGEHNAFTGKEYTGYYTKLMPKHIEKAFDFLSDLLLNSKFDAEEMEKEKGVILQEISMYEDLPMEMVGNYFEEAVYGQNALGRDIIGRPESVKGIDREKLVAYRDSHYFGENAVLALAGNFGGLGEEDLIALSEKYFRFPERPVSKLPEIELKKGKAHKIVVKKTEQSHLVIGFRTVPLVHPDYFKLELLSIILGGSMSSRMFEEIREKRGLAYAVRTCTSNYIESGALITQAGVPHEKVYEAAEAIVGEYKKIKEEKVPEEELQKAKEIVNGRMLIKFEDSEELAHYFASDKLLLNEIITPEELVKIYQSVTADDILEVAKKYLVDDGMGMAFIGPEFLEEKLEEILKIS